MKQAVVLAGGKGERLRSITGGKPKPLAPMGGTTLLGHQLVALERYGFDEAVVLVDYEADQIRDWVSQNWRGTLRVSFVEDGTPRGTAGAIIAAHERLEAEFLVTYADTLFEVQLDLFISSHKKRRNAAATLFVHPNDHPHDSDLIDVDEDDRIVAFHPYPHPKDAWLPNRVNAALYYVCRDDLLACVGDMPKGIADFGRHLFPAMLARGMLLYAYASSEYIKDAGTPDRWESVQRDLASGWVKEASFTKPQRAILTDRDGTLNQDHGHIVRAEQLNVFRGVGPAMRRVNKAHWLSIVVTNQPVLARGETTWTEMRRIHARLDTELAREQAWIDGVFICPHHPHRGFSGEVPELKVVCGCRKPSAGLLMQARERFNLDLKQCWMIGDSSADIGAAYTAGVSMVVVRTGEGGLDGKYPYDACFTANDYSGAVNFILGVYPSLSNLLTPVVSNLKGCVDLLVGGCSRSGKSTASGVIERELRLSGIPCHVIHLDRFLLSEHERGDGVLNRYDMKSIASCMCSLARRDKEPVTIELPSYSRRFRERGKDTLRIVVSKNAVIIWDGVIAGFLRDIAPTAHQYLYMDASEPERAGRFFEYDADRGISDELSRRHWAARSVDEHPLIQSTSVSATYVLSFDEIFGNGTNKRHER